MLDAKEVRRLPANDWGRTPEWFLGVLGGVPGKAMGDIGFILTPEE